mmetsp:Transcript_33906/g.56030  ORF Transcript_33906/g.56030 Transcript_33906/m.56030 type:complete len:94 (-) Transcript_33906:460-741(-)|eukprot:CAMPEP_0119343248 /NCGR_PEP_ID=MMETSP1333-20130426/106346_1 /TAXON_ID=418940 /ORGANISM="Scyphosphaera apsteinii, Strain RCC1455" /LENGTH=93 /DNA_ID=CAMNT_0007355629 /DNA_START=35 /DNA_END=316 /DNA_ORIENTATION=+
MASSSDDVNVAARLDAEIEALAPDNAALGPDSHAELDAHTEYLDSCRDLCSAIDSLESALISFTGKEDGIKGQIFVKTKSRLETELAARSRNK